MYQVALRVFFKKYKSNHITLLLNTFLGLFKTKFKSLNWSISPPDPICPLLGDLPSPSAAPAKGLGWSPCLYHLILAAADWPRDRQKLQAGLSQPTVETLSSGIQGGEWIMGWWDSELNSQVLSSLQPASWSAQDSNKCLSSCRGQRSN